VGYIYDHFRLKIHAHVSAIRQSTVPILHQQKLHVLRRSIAIHQIRSVENLAVLFVRPSRVC